MTSAKVTSGMAASGMAADAAAARPGAGRPEAVKPGQGSATPGSAKLSRRQQVIFRTLAGVVGGYAFCWGLGAFSMALLFTIGMGFHDAEHLLAIVTFLIYPCLFMWAFFAPDLKRLALVLLGGGGLMAAAATLLQWRLV